MWDLKTSAWDFVFCKSRREEFLDLELASGHVSKLLLKVTIDLGLILIVKLQFSISGFVYLEDS